MIDRYAGEMVAAADTVSRRWRHGAEVDVNEQMMSFALDVVGRTIFDADVESEAPEIREVLDAGMQVFHRFLLPGADMLWRLPLPATRRFDAAKADIDAMIERMIAERRGQPAGVGLLDHLLTLGLTDEQIRDEAITLMLAGHETTAQLLTWAWFLLARNPSAEDALVAELREVLGSRAATAADYPRLTYTQAVVRETLRIYPPVWALGADPAERVPAGRCDGAGGHDDHHQPVGGAALRAVLARPDGVPARALAGRLHAAVGCLLSLRDGRADVHRRALRDARGGAGAGDARARLARGAAVCRGRARPPVHAAPKGRHAGGTAPPA